MLYTTFGVPFIGCMYAVHNIWCTGSQAVCTLYTIFGVPFIGCMYAVHNLCTVHRLYVRCTQLGVPFIGCMYAVHNIWCTGSQAVCTLYTIFGVFIGCMYAVHNLYPVHRLYVRCTQLAQPTVGSVLYCTVVFKCISEIYIIIIIIIIVFSPGYSAV